MATPRLRALPAPAPARQRKTIGKFARSLTPQGRTTQLARRLREAEAKHKVLVEEVLRDGLVLSAPDYVGPKRDRQEIDALVTQNRVARADFDALDRRALLSPPAPPTQSQPAGLSALLEARGL